MSQHLRWAVANRNPSITETITDEAGTPIDLSGKTVKFMRRAVGSDTPDIEAPAVVESAGAGEVRYDWAAADVDEPGWFLVWWEVTTGTSTQDVGEALVEFAAHAPTVGYVELEELRSTLQIEGTTHADKDLVLAIEAASGVVDMLTGQTFTPAAADTRKYTPVSTDWLAIDHADAVTTLESNGTLLTEGVDFFVDSRDVVRLLNGTRFYRAPQSVTVVADFGYDTVPAEVKAATTIIATQIMKRAREAAFGVLAMTLDGSAIRIGRTDPQVDLLLARFRRTMVE